MTGVGSDAMDSSKSDRDRAGAITNSSTESEDKLSVEVLVAWKERLSGLRSPVHAGWDRSLIVTESSFWAPAGRGVAAIPDSASSRRMGEASRRRVTAQPF